MTTMIRIAKFIVGEPFRPFRINLNDGRVFDVELPDMVSVGISRMRIFTLWSDDPEVAKTQQVELALEQIASVDWIDSGREAKSN